MKSRFQSYTTYYDCKRKIIIPKNYDPKIHTMLDTEPFVNKEECLLHRTLMKHFSAPVYNRYNNKKIIPTSNNILKESIKYFIY